MQQNFGAGPYVDPIASELQRLQLEELQERRKQTVDHRNQRLAAQKQNAMLQEAARQQKIIDQSHCMHRHPNGGVALAGQRMSRGGKRNWLLMCQLCQAEFDDKNPPKDRNLTVKMEFFGGPSF